MAASAIASVPFVASRPIRWGETDAAQIGYTVRFFDYAMEAIEDWFRAVLDTDWYQLNLDRHTGTPFVHIEMHIGAPLTPRHRLHSTVLIDRLGGASLRFCVLGRRDDGVASFRAHFTCCFVDNRSMKPQRIDGTMRTRIAQYIAAGGGSEHSAGAPRAHEQRGSHREHRATTGRPGRLTNRG